MGTQTGRTKSDTALQSHDNWRQSFVGERNQLEGPTLHGSGEEKVLYQPMFTGSSRIRHKERNLERFEDTWPVEDTWPESSRTRHKERNLENFEEAWPEISSTQHKERVLEIFENTRPNGSHGDSTAEKSAMNDGATKAPGMFTEEEISRKYEEIWGGLTKRRPPDREPPVRRVEGIRGKIIWKGMYFKISMVLSRRKRRQRLMSPAKKAALQRYKKQLKARKASKLRQLRARSQREVHRSKIPKVRPKWIRWTRLRASNFSSWSSGSWHRRFAILNQRNQQFMKGLATPRLIDYRTLKVPQEFKKVLTAHDSSASLKEAWEQIPRAARRQIWPELMIQVLEDSPEKALKVLTATYTLPYPPGYAVVDCLDYIFAFYLQKQQHRTAESSGCETASDVEIAGSFSTAHEVVESTSTEESSVIETASRSDIAAELIGTKSAPYLLRVYLRLLREGPPDYLHLSQNSIFLLMSNSNVDDMKTLYNTLEEVKHPLHQNTLMQFASLFAQSGETDLAFRILNELNVRGCDFNTPKMLSLCTTLLQRTYRGPDAHVSDSEMFQFMLSSGMRPNIITYNVLLQNELEAGDAETAWQIHELMIENGIEPDAHTYSILLNDAKWRMDPSAIRSVMGHVRKKGIRNAHIVTDVLHAILMLHQREKPTYDISLGDRNHRPAAFARMLQAYRESFYIESLARIIPNFAEKYSTLSTSELSSPHMDYLADPPAPTLVVMITGYLSELDSQSAKEFFDHFCALVFAGDSAVAKLMGTTHVWNLILMAFGRFSDRLSDCPKVIGAMISPTLKGAAIKANEALSLDAGDSTDGEPQSGPDESTVSQENQPTESEDSNGEADIQHSEHRSPTASPPPDPSSITPPSPSPHAQSKKNSPLVTYSVPKPDVFTWSILLKIFIDQGQRRAAEKVLFMMLERGITPNLVTWNTLTFGYSRLQDPARTADVIHRLEEAGLRPDDITMKGLQIIRDRRALIEAMKRKGVEGTTSSTKISWKSLDQVKWALRKDMEDEEKAISAKLKELEEKGIVRDL